MLEAKYIVLIKQVPDMEEVKFDYEEGTVDRSSAELEPNPFDLNALEEAVQYKENFGGEVVAISMGPKQAEFTLREATARGADEGILLHGSRFAGSDTWATSVVLGNAIDKVGDYDLIFTGEKTVDGDTGQVGPEVAQFLDIPHVSFVSNVLDRREDEVEVETEVWNATFVKKMKLPGLLTFTKDVNEPRLPSFKAKSAARKAEIETWGAEELSIDAEELGIKGSPTRVSEMEVPPPQKREPTLLRDEPEVAVSKLLEDLDLGRIKS